jgi:hypothetical protein
MLSGLTAPDLNSRMLSGLTTRQLEGGGCCGGLPCGRDGDRVGDFDAVDDQSASG